MKPSNKTKNIPVIEKYDVGDGVERRFIDSYEKLIYWVDSKFEEQKKSNNEQLIDLSNLVILINRGNDSFWIGKLCDQIDGIINLGNDKDIQPDEKGGIIIKNDLQFEIKYCLKFDNSIIYRINFWNTKFCKYVSFTNTRFLGGAMLKGSTFLGIVDFIQTDISQKSINDEILPNISGYIGFQNIIFYEKVRFVALKWDVGNNFHFSNNTYEEDVEFILCSITNQNDNYYDFSGSIFKSNVIIDGRARPDVQPKRVSHINFGSSYFHKKLKIWGIIIGDISMQNCHFYDTVSITFNKYDISSIIDFSYSTIKSLFFIDSDLGDDKGESINLSNEISFYKTLIRNDAFIFLRNINNDKSSINQGSLNFGYANILGTITVQDSKLNKIILGKSTLTGTVNIEDVDSEYDCRESIAKIKNEFLKKNDIVNSLSFKSQEMKYYSEHLDFKYGFITKPLHWFTKYWYSNIIGIVILPLLLLISLIPIKSFEKLREYTLLYFNRISNSFGMSWGQGIIFTCMTAWIFFVMINSWGINEFKFFEWSWRGWDSFGQVWKSYLGILNVLNFKDTLSGIELNAKGETLFFLSKIFIAYGIYQTISAFRKYGK